MAGYNASKDVEVKKFKRKTFGLTRLQITAHKYGDKGDLKIQITRQRRDTEETDDWKWAKLGRLLYDEVRWVTKILARDVVPWMKEAEENGEEE